MDDKTALEILMKMLGKYKFEAIEKKAILKAIGVLSWTKLAGSRIKRIAERQKAKRSDRM